MLLEEERSALQTLPKQRFEARRVARGQADSLSLVRFDRNSYSVPTAYAHQDVTVVGGVDQVKIVCRDHLVATHPRCWGREHTNTFNTYSPPNAPYPDVMKNGFGWFSPRSKHPGGVNSAFLDGSVRWISNDVEPTAFRGLGTRAGGEALGELN